MNSLGWQVKAIFAGVALLVAFCFGWSVHGWKFDAELKRQADAALEQKAQYEELARGLVKRYQEAEAAQKVVYRNIKEKIYVETTGTVCLGPGAVGLWNDALGGVPDSSAGTAETTPAAGKAATDRDLVKNAVENFQQYTECRAQLNALIEWYNVVYK